MQTRTIKLISNILFVEKKSNNKHTVSKRVKKSAQNGGSKLVYCAVLYCTVLYCTVLYCLSLYTFTVPTFRHKS